MIGIRKRICRFCENSIEYLDYKDEKTLLRFVTEQGKIIPRRISGSCAFHHHQLVKAIKHARHLAIIPFKIDVPR
jgi:small subunit ribosomal protein S18